MTPEWSRRLAGSSAYARSQVFPWDSDGYARWIDQARRSEDFDHASSDVRAVVTQAEAAGPPSSWPTILPVGVEAEIDVFRAE